MNLLLVVWEMEGKDFCVYPLSILGIEGEHSQKSILIDYTHHFKTKEIGQVTGANRAMLQKAVDLVSQGFISKAYPTRTLSDIAAHGLSKNDVGKVILF